MFWIWPTGDGVTWQNVCESGKQLLEQLHTAALFKTPESQTMSRHLLHAQIAQVQHYLAGTEAQLSSLEASDTEAQQFDWESVLGQLFFPPVSRVGIRQFQTQSLLAYAALLRGYLALLEDACRGLDNPEPPAPKREKVPIA